jgi:ubiquinone/menaquinone biosynthesis C-methylase UbiE
MSNLPELKMVYSHRVITTALSDAITQHFRDKDNTPLNILEAGCGSQWALDLVSVEYTLTGVDIYERDLEIRKNEKKDLDLTIVGDLRTISLGKNIYDIIYNSFVLEHVDGAEQVLDNFVKWVKPGGLIILRIPDRDTCFGFFTRTTPLWLHLFYKRYIMGSKKAGTPGYGPFSVFYDKIVSRKGIHAYCKMKGLTIQAEYGTGGYFKYASFRTYLANVLIWVAHIASFGSLADKHGGLTFIIKKP